jgi:DNA-binding MarR family transcriptional regulator
MRSEIDSSGSSSSSSSSSSSLENELQLLEALADSPKTSQADLAARVGVAVGTVNWYLKRWSKKGYVKASRLSRWSWSYLLTPQGMAHKARLASQYIEASMMLYRRTRAEAHRLLEQVLAAGYTEVYVDGEGEIAEICYLTCLERKIARCERPNPALPVLQVDGSRIELIWPEPLVDSQPDAQPT